MKAPPARLAWFLSGGVALAALAYDPSAPAAAPKRVLGLLLAVVLLTFAIVGTRHTSGAAAKRVGWGGAAWTAYVAFALTSLAWGRAPGFVTIAAWVAGTAILFAARSLGLEASRRAARVAAWMIGFGTSLIGVTQWVSGARGIAVHGGQGNANWLGLVLACTLPLSIELAAEGRRQRASWWLAAAAGTALQLPALVASASRVAWVALACAALLVVVMRIAKRPVGKVTASVGVLTVLAVAMSYGHSVWAKGVDDPGAERPPDAMVPAAEALAGRAWIWRNTIDAAGRAQPFGTGLGGFAHAFQEAQGRRLATLNPRAASRQFHNAQTAHQDALQALVETGIPGALLLLIAFVMTVRAFARDRWAGGLAVMTAVAVCAMGDSPMHQPAIVFLLGLVLGAEPPGPHMGHWRPATLGVLLVTSSALLAEAARTWLAARWVHEAQSAALEPRRTLLERAARVAPRSGEAMLALGLARLEQADAPGAVKALSRSRELLANVGTDIALGNARMELGEGDAAIASYRRALTLNPGSLRAHANLAEALREAGRLDEAQEHLDIAKRLSPGHPKLPALEENLRRSKQEAGMAP